MTLIDLIESLQDYNPDMFVRMISGEVDNKSKQVILSAEKGQGWPLYNTVELLRTLDAAADYAVVVAGQEDPLTWITNDICF